MKPYPSRLTPWFGGPYEWHPQPDGTVVLLPAPDEDGEVEL